MSTVPAGIRTSGDEGTTRLTLVRHGEARCNVDGIVGGIRGDTGLTEKGREQASALAAAWMASGECGRVDALYTSVLPRAIETAEIIAPAIEWWRDGDPLMPSQECNLCELHPGESDGLDWGTFSARYGEPDWDEDPGLPLAPGGESWTSFVDRASGAVADVGRRHVGENVVVVCHAGVIEATLLRLLPVDREVARLKLRTVHASWTVFEGDGERWTLERYNSRAPQQA